MASTLASWPTSGANQYWRKLGTQFAQPNQGDSHDHAKSTVSFQLNALKISTGGNSAGNGGNGYNSGDITNKASIDFNPTNKAYGADVQVNTGDHVQQKAYWDAGGANAQADLLSKAHGGTATSYGDQSNSSGYDTSKVHADTTAYQDNWLAASQSQSVGAHMEK